MQSSTWLRKGGISKHNVEYMTAAFFGRQDKLQSAHHNCSDNLAEQKEAFLWQPYTMNFQCACSCLARNLGRMQWDDLSAVIFGRLWSLPAMGGGRRMPKDFYLVFDGVWLHAFASRICAFKPPFRSHSWIVTQSDLQNLKGSIKLSEQFYRT